MGAEDSWAVDTVALGGGRKGEGEPVRPESPRRRVSRLRLSAPTPRVGIVCAAALVVVTALVAVLSSGSDSPKAPIRDVADPAPRIVVRQPTRRRRPKPRRPARPHVRRKAKGGLGGKREPKVDAATHERDSPERTPEPMPEPAPTPTPEPLPATNSAPAPGPKPTSPAVEFGM
jgi:hypothetical protein